MPWSTQAKNEALNAVTINLLSLHDGDPGADGTANEIAGVNRKPASFGAAVNGERTLEAEVTFTGGVQGQTVAYLGFWEDGNPAIFKGAQAITGDTAFNSLGEFVISTGTKIRILDPA